MSITVFEKNKPQKEGHFKRIGFISTRIAGTDGVSLEIAKWATVLERNHYECYYFAGLCNRPKERSFIVEEAHFEHPEIREIHEKAIRSRKRPRKVSEQVHKLKNHLKDKIYEFVKKFKIDLIITENALSIPMNIPLGLALTEFIAETGKPTIAHHHDFYWERTRYLVNSVMDYIDRAFPPYLPFIRHVVINSLASEQLSHRKGISNVIIPNVYDFANPPQYNKARCERLRELIGFNDQDCFVLQPTRVIPRKWIERAIEIVGMMQLRKPILVISHASGDEGDIYFQRIQEYAGHWGVEIRSIDHLIRTDHDPADENTFTIGEVYQSADLVTYPSGYEGFGNAFLEAIYFRKPIVVNRYSIYVADIEPKGFQVISFDGFVSRKTIHSIYEILNNKALRNEITKRNYELAKQYFSYEVLERKLLQIIRELEYETRVGL